MGKRVFGQVEWRVAAFVFRVDIRPMGDEEFKDVFTSAPNRVV